MLTRPVQQKNKFLSLKHIHSWQKLPLILLLITVIAVIIASIQLINFASHGKSDISVLLRTAALLKAGAGGELYTEKDKATNWPRCIPPAGMVFIQPLQSLGPTWAGIIWTLINLSLLTGASVALYYFIEKLDYQKHIYQNLFPYALMILFLLAIGSIQVGQFSLLFLSCWIFYLYASSDNHSFWGGVSLSIPSAIKLYPLLMLAVPLFSGKRKAVSVISFFFIGILILVIILPFAFYGTRTLDLSVSFVKHTLLSPEGMRSVYRRLTTGSLSNQGLDAVLLRYLTHSPEFHSKFSYVPHLNLTRQNVLLLADIIRVVIILITSWVALRWFRHVKNKHIYSSMMMAALWSSALYLIIPLTKSRYAVYTFIGFLPLLEMIEIARIKRNWPKYVSLLCFMLLCFVLILLAIPDYLRAYGIGILGALGLWAANVKLMSVK
ncbi:MAG: glycosyltransferase family 87 protein [Candidatus Aminicenantales bacterium]